MNVITGNDIYHAMIDSSILRGNFLVGIYITNDNKRVTMISRDDIMYGYGEGKHVEDSIINAIINFAFKKEGVKRVSKGSDETSSHLDWWVFMGNKIVFEREQNMINGTLLYYNDAVMYETKMNYFEDGIKELEEWVKLQDEFDYNDDNFKRVLDK